MMKRKYAGNLLLLLCMAFPAFSQEVVAPLRFNSLLSDDKGTIAPIARKTTALALPFFEDFTDYSLYPNESRWADSAVYVNNTMGFGVLSRGVATFDALNKHGRPYDTINRFALVYADSLTSQPFDLSSYQPRDSIYLSFFYQPQGTGFSPEISDSLMLFFHRQNGAWEKMWTLPGLNLLPFRQVMIPVSEPGYLYDGFQFRFVNKATLNTNDDVWNIDYIRMAASRTIADTAVRDLAFTSNPSNLLNDYTSMPYRQYLANPAAERAATHSDSIRSHYSTNSTVNYGYRAVETTTGTALSSGTGNINIAAFSKERISFPTYTTTVTPPSSTSRIVYQNTYYLQSGSPIEPKANDTIVHEQVFDNYLAYDDGSAEKSYFLNLDQALPGKTAIEFRLNAPDTLQGVAIYFGQQVPTATAKTFSVAVYSQLAGIAGAASDIKLFEQNDLLPLFVDGVNHFTVYKFDSPIQLPAGVFYLGTVQPAFSGSDSLYFGLDVNRIGGNHLYVNLQNMWTSSVVSGALMIRPLLGRPVAGTDVQDTQTWAPAWSFYPNPVQTTLNIEANIESDAYSISDMQGRTVQEGPYKYRSISTASLSPGLYMLRIRYRQGWSLPRKFIKQ